MPLSRYQLGQGQRHETGVNYTSWLTDLSDSPRTQLIFRLGARPFQLSVLPI